MKAVCAVEGCVSGCRRGSSWCEKHHARWKRHGDPCVVLKRRRNSNDPLPTLRVCTACSCEKSLNDFSRSAKSGLGVKSVCKDCAAKQGRLYRERNIERERVRSRAYTASHLEQVAARKRRWREQNPDRAREADNAWRAANPLRVAATNKRVYERQRTDPQKRIENSISACINQSIRRGSKARRRTEEILGYSFHELKIHLERQFVPGMSWANYGNGDGHWHIDHIVPKAAFKYETPDCPEFRAAWALTNLRPLWDQENRQKHAKRLLLL